MQASTGDQPSNVANQVQADSSGSDHDIHAVPDVELLKFQKQRSTPKVRLSEVNVDGEEVLHMEVEDFGNMSGP